INLTYEGVKEAFEISPGIFVQPGEYDHAEGFVAFGTDSGAPISWSMRTTVGGFFGGDRVSSNQTLRLRYSEILTSEISWNYNNVNLPVGDFDVNLGRLRLSYSPTPKLLLQLLTQYNDQDDDISTNLRFSWLRTASTGLFVVYNEIDEFGSNPVQARADRSLIIKYSHLIDVFAP
ncbi:MAG: hydrolase, partial [Thermoanaerobaculia bacterium]|nr:hydrolase [Thermoanaerobaculia bacterium]